MRIKNVKNDYNKSKSKRLNDIEPPKSNFNTIEVIAIMVITTLFGIIVGGSVTYFFKGSIGIDKNSKELLATYNTILDNYYGKVSEENLKEAAIKGMISYLDDPYAGYIDNTDTSFNETLEGEYYGLGIEVMKQSDNLFLIANVFKNSPAEKSGLKKDDIICEVNGNSVKELSLNDLSNLIKKTDNNNKIVIKVKRKNEEKEVTINRDLIELSSVSGDIIETNNKKIGLITISVFAKNTYNQFKDTFLALEKDKVDSLIIDIRGNSGGYLSSAKEVAEMFLNKDDVIFLIKDNNSTKKEYATKNKKINIPVVVLINGSTASASEILAASLKENLKIELIGAKTYGKGTVQQTKTLSNGAIIKYTSEQWLTPKGNSIDKVGISPTIEVDMNKKYYEEPKMENDNQLQKAIEVLSSK